MSAAQERLFGVDAVDYDREHPVLHEGCQELLREIGVCDRCFAVEWIRLLPPLR